jgi:hypothetical protein
VTRPASETFEIETIGVGVDRQRGWKALRLLSFLLDGDDSPTWPRKLPKIHLIIREKADGSVIFEAVPADPEVVALARQELARLDEDEFQRSWASPD